MQPITIDSIKNARERISPYIRKTPFLPFDHFNGTHEKNVFLKCENLQKTGSFKIRGAANCILENLAHAKKSGVVAASAGNHAQGVAAMCKFLGVKATIVMPVTTPYIKVQNTGRWGARVELVGNIYDESFIHAMKLAEERGFLFIHPFHDPLVIAGQGTIGLELVEDPLFQDAEAVVISVGGGGLSTGIATVLRQLKPNMKIYGVTAKNAPAAWKSFHKGKALEEAVTFTLAEGVATKKTDPEMLTFLKSELDDFFSLGEESIALAVSLLAEHAKMVVEGAGALPVAAMLEKRIPEKHVALIVSGGNIDIPVLSNVLQRGLLEQGRIIRLLVTIADRPGALHSITEVLAEQRANIVQVYHQRATFHARFGETEIELDIETRGHEHSEEVTHALTGRGFHVTRVS